MPKDEFDFEDPFELNGMAMLTREDTAPAMAECFIEEFMRMGHGPEQLLSLFRNPFYIGPNMVYQRRGEPFIRDMIADVFARRGKAVAWDRARLEPVTGTSAPTESGPAPAARFTDPMGGPLPNFTA